MVQLQTDEDAMACARRGAALLDLVDPGWDADIDPGDVRLFDYCGCVLAHYGKPRKTMTAGLVRLREKCLELGMTFVDTCRLGFATETGDTTPSLAYWYAPLQRAWDTIFAERRAARETR